LTSISPQRKHLGYFKGPVPASSCLSGLPTSLGKQTRNNRALS
jgi:hypothetical protein